MYEYDTCTRRKKVDTYGLRDLFLAFGTVERLILKLFHALQTERMRTRQNGHWLLFLLVKLFETNFTFHVSGKSNIVYHHSK